MVYRKQRIWKTEEMDVTWDLNQNNREMEMEKEQCWLPGVTEVGKEMKECNRERIKPSCSSSLNKGEQRHKEWKGWRAGWD